MSTILWQKLSILLGKDVPMKSLDSMDEPAFDAMLNNLAPEKKQGLANLLAEAMQNPSLVFPKKLKASDFDHLPDPVMPKWQADANSQSSTSAESLEQKMPLLLFFVSGWHVVLFGKSAALPDEPTLAHLLAVEIAQQRNTSPAEIPEELNGMQSLIGAVVEVYGAMPFNQLRELVNLAKQHMQASDSTTTFEVKLQQYFLQLATPASLAANVEHARFVDAYRRKIHRAVNWRPAQMPTQADFDRLDDLLVA